MIKPLDNYDDVIHTNAKTMMDEHRLNPIPSNIILNKVLTGWGATYCEIKADRHSIILLPHKSQIHNKHNQHAQDDNTCPVTEKQNVTYLVKHIKSSKGRNIKFLSTPEGLHKVIKAVVQTGGNPYLDYFLLIDECHKITKDVNYRANISIAMDDFFTFENKAMISATPFKPSDPRFMNFQLVKVEHEIDIKKDITLFCVNNLGAAFKEYIEKYEGELLFVFFNTLSGIDALIKKHNLKETANVYCSEDGVKDFILSNFENVYSEIDPERVAKVNFLTSSFFNGLDIKGLKALPDILILTDIKYRAHTIIDPNTDTYQILGRFRQDDPYAERVPTYNSAMHIVNTRFNTIVKIQERAIEDFKISKLNYEKIQDLQATTQDEYLRDQVFGEALKRETPYYNLLDESGYFDHFRYDNYLYSYKLKECYGHGIASGVSYCMSGLFNVSFKNKVYLPEEFEAISKPLSRYSKSNILWACEMLVANENQQGTEGAKEYYRELARRFPLVIRAVNDLGYEAIHELGYKKSSIERELLRLDIQKGKVKQGVVDVVYKHFYVGASYDLQTIKRKLEEIFIDFQLKANAKATDLSTYFTYQEYTGHKKLLKREIKALENSGQVDETVVEVEGVKTRSVRMYKLLERKFNAISPYSTR